MMAGILHALVVVGALAVQEDLPVDIVFRGVREMVVYLRDDHLSGGLMCDSHRIQNPTDGNELTTCDRVQDNIPQEVAL